MGSITNIVTIGPVAYAGSSSSYSNSLMNSALVSSNFTSYTTVDSDYINHPSGGFFAVAPNFGLQLFSTKPNYVEGLVAYNQPLQASNDWTITIQSHISSFTNSQPNPHYSAGISVIHTSTNGLEYPDRVELNLVRAGVSGALLSNSIISSLYVNNGETDTVANQSLTNVYLQLHYTASNRTIASAYSINGTNFVTIQSYVLSNEWNMQGADSFTLGIVAEDQPDGRVVPNFNVLPGTIYLRNLTVASSNSPQNVSTGGTLSLGGQNTYSGGGLTMTNGGTLTFVGGTNSGSGTISFGGGGLTMGVGSLSMGTGSLTLGNGSLTIGGGTFTNGSSSITLGNGSLSIAGSTNGLSIGAGSLTVGAGGVIIVH